jgi:RHS repeat-associated protein
MRPLPAADRAVDVNFLLQRKAPIARSALRWSAEPGRTSRLFRSEPARPSSGFFSKKHGRTAFLTSVVMTLSVLSASSDTTTPPPLGALATSTVSSSADYVYDEAGRLVTVLHPSGELARYEYDAAGNITRIKRETAPTQGVVDFNPRIGKAGTPVTILGRGFDNDPTKNTVTFGPEAASVISASPNRLEVRVPDHAANGQIRIVTPAGTFTSPRSFVVPPPGPSISGVVPNVVEPGTTAVISGSNFRPRTIENVVSLNGVLSEVPSATATALTVTIPQQAASGPLTVATPYGDAISGDIFVPISPFQASDVGFTGRLGVDGSIVTANLPVTGKIGMLIFAGTAGQRITMTVSDVAIDNVDVSIVKPDGGLLVWNGHYRGQASAFIDTKVLPLAGTYTVLIDPRNDDVGSVMVALNPVPDDETGTITVGGPAVTATAAVPGQNSKRTFAGTAGQRITMTVSDVAIDNVDVSIVKPDGGLLVWNGHYRGQSPTSQPATLPVAGTYTVLIDPRNDDTGTVKVKLSANSNPPALPGINPAVAIHAPAANLPPQPQLKPHMVSAAPTSMESSVAAVAVRAETKRVVAAVPGMLKGPKATPAAKRTGATGDLAGVVLRLDGRPLAQVRVWADKMQTRTDSAGNFTLTGLPLGHHELYVDGSTANTSRDRYGLFEIGADVEAGKLTILPSTIWMTELDTEHEIAIPSPTTKTTIISTPRIKGLEVHLPAGTVVRDEDGKPVRRLGITRIPIDKTPFPLPKIGVQTPVYFTVQPGGSYVFPKGARIIYPNYTDLPARQRVEFWNYDPEERGWHIYGYGRVSSDRKQVIPDAGVMVYNFAGAMFNPANTPPADGPPPGACSQAGDPVDCSTGLFLNTQTDLRLADIIPLEFARTYRSNDAVSRAFGIGSSSSYDLYLWSAEQYQKVDLVMPDGGRMHYKRVSAGTGYQDAVFEHTGSATSFHKSRISWAGDLNGWRLRLKDGTALEFQQYRSLRAIVDRFGNRISIERTNSGRGPISHITTPSGRWISFTSDSAGRITEARDNIGRTVSYAYDTLGRLNTVTDPAGGVWRYTYDSAHRMLSVTTPRGTTKVSNTYNQDGRVQAQTLADGGQWHFAYQLTAGKVTETQSTDPRGQKNRITYNSEGYPLIETQALGTSVSQTIIYTRDASNFITSVVDPLKRKTEFTRDTLGNLTSVTRAAGTSEESRSSLTYNPDYSQIASITDPLGSSTALRYDGRGALVEVTDALGRTTKINNDTAGRPVTVTNALNATTTLTYDRGRLSSITDPLKRTRRQWSDSAGRLTFSVDAVGAVTSRAFDELDRITDVSDVVGSAAHWSYDPNGNLLALTDPRGGVTRWAYDSKDRRISRTDPLNGIEQHSYDNDDNVVERVDRRGVVSTNAYDTLGRLVSSSYGAGESDTFSFDAGNRITRASSSDASGTRVVTRVFDTLDRLITEQTGHGKVAYEYDKADRRTTMSIAGQAAVLYVYNAAHELTSIGRGNARVGFALDAVGRRTSVSLPNGIVSNYTYDEADQIRAISYSRAGTTLGALDYSYDHAGRRQAIGGSLANVDLPDAVSSTAYDASNRLTKWGQVSLAYDDNGNLVQDGSRSYTWNSRNMLSTVGGATFRYDAFGRRSEKTIANTTISYLYDGLNPVQELSGTTPKATMLAGLSVDEFYARFEGTNSSYYLTDAIGSTVALSDMTGLTTRYGYQPFGASSAVGPPSTNPYQFTGRENDQTGLYHYRARYYSPATHRFISEDPVGAEQSGTNRYEYANSNPNSFTDPLGTMPGAAISIFFVPGLGQALLFATIGVLLIGALITLTYYGSRAVCAAMEGGTDTPDAEGTAGSDQPTANDPVERDWKQDKKLSDKEAEKLIKGGEHPHDIKGSKHAGNRDLYKDKDGNIYVKPKGGSGPGEPTGLNINDF